MRLRILTGVLTASLLVSVAVPANANRKTDRIVPAADSDSMANDVRDLFVQEIRAHAIEVHEAKLHRQKVRRAAAAAAREAAAAAAAAEAATRAAPSYSSSYGGGGALSSEQIASLARAAGFPESVISTMVAIVFRESGGNPGAVNGGGPAVAGGSACGLYQLYPCPGPDALDPARNTALAYSKYQSAGLSPWASSA
jgi:hypothetical protein